MRKSCRILDISQAAKLQLAISLLPLEVRASNVFSGNRKCYCGHITMSSVLLFTVTVWAMSDVNKLLRGV